MKVFAEKEAEKFLEKYVLTAKSWITKNEKQAEMFSKKTGFPLVLKIISKQALHKTEIGGVKIVKKKEDFSNIYNDLLAIAKKKKIKLDGILVQELLTGLEVIIGIKKDATFGHAVMIGLGGTLVEEIKDVSFRVCPITDKDAGNMINELKLKKLFYGFRGSKPVNINILKKAIVAVSKIPLKNKNLSELDINPFIINEKTGKVADARVVFE